MTSTVQQNRAHRTSTTWRKTPANSGGAMYRDNAGEGYTSEYVNVFTGQAIRKSWRMTGVDWHIFDADGTKRAGGYASLTTAKFYAENYPA